MKINVLFHGKMHSPDIPVRKKYPVYNIHRYSSMIQRFITDAIDQVNSYSVTDSGLAE